MNNHDSGQPGAGRLALRMLLLLFLLALLVPSALNHWTSWQRQRALTNWTGIHQEGAGKASQMGEYRRAEMILEEAIKADPGNPELRLQHLLAFATRAAEQPQSFAESELDALGYALEILGTTSEAAHRPLLETARGRLALRKGKLEEARAILTKSIAAAPSYIPGRLALANLERVAGRPLEALEALEKAVATDATNLGALNNLGVLYVELERPEDGAKMFEKALLVKDNPASRMNAADALARSNRLPEAIAHLEAAVKLDANSADLYRRLGTLRLKAKKLPEAEEALVASLKLAEDPDAAFALGLVYQAQSRLDKALPLFDKLVQANPKALDALFERARCLQALARPEQAATDFEQYLALAKTAPGTDPQRVQAAQAALTALRK
jgi:tetratricopeptide (TPR) repeat protein